jgi:DNA-binding LytR/AlgR family response regulator
MIKCIIVDDEPLARELLQGYIEQLPELELLGSYASAVEAFSALHQVQVDLMFLDIAMPGINGISFVKSLKSTPSIVFVTAYTEHAVEAFDLDVADYLVKPVTFERFLKAVQKTGTRGHDVASHSLPQERDHLFLKVDRRLIRVEFTAIEYIEALGDYLKVHTPRQVFVTYMALGKIERLLPKNFLRIHRSTIINVAYIQFIEGNMVHLTSKVLSMGQSYREGVLKMLS